MTSHDDEKDRLFALIPPVERGEYGLLFLPICDFCFRSVFEPVYRDPNASMLVLRAVTDDLQICEGCWEKPEVKAQFTLDELRQAAGEKEKAA